MKLFIPRSIITLVWIACSALDSAADPTPESLDAYRRGDYAQALQLLRPQAQHGDAWSQNLLAKLFAKGQGVEKNQTEAFQWHLKAADQGFVDSQYYVAEMYAAGRGVPTNKPVAFEWFKRAAEVRDPDAAFSLAEMYERGEGTSRDLLAAYVWYNLAAANGHDEAPSNRERLGAKLTAAQALEAQRVSFETYQKLYHLGPFAQPGQERREWVPTAPDAQYKLGMSYAAGRTAPRHDLLALEWIGRSAKQGYAPAQNMMGKIYVEARGVARDLAKARDWYRRAAKQGNAESQFALGQMDLEGESSPVNTARAFSWIQKAATQDYHAAQFKLGEMYLSGTGTPQNYVDAHMWINLAAAAGVSGAAAKRDQVAAMMANEQVALAQKMAREWKPSYGK